jgi:hypothetical protein
VVGIRSDAGAIFLGTFDEKYPADQSAVQTHLGMVPMAF